MKKVLLMGSVLIGTILIFLTNISTTNSTDIVAVDLNERVKAVSGYEMKTIICLPSGSYDRCEPPTGTCDVSKQTECDS